METLARPDRTRRLMADFFGGRCRTTLDCYSASWRDFARWLGASSVEDAAERLLGQGAGEANQLALAYKNAMVERGLAASTVRSRITALRSLVKLAKLTGTVSWDLGIATGRGTPVQDTRGPGEAGYRALLAAAESARDRAILHLLYDCALRRVEVVRLALEDYRDGALFVLGKGRTEQERMTLPPETSAALDAWIAERGREPGSLFGVCGRTVLRIVGGLGRKAGIGKVRTHALRHAAITTALELTNGNVREVARFSRHRDIQTVLWYDDCRVDTAGKIAAMVAAGRQANG